MLSNNSPMAKNKITLGEFFKEIRKRRGWSQADCAKALGVFQTYVSFVERDTYDKPPLEVIKALHNKVLTLEEKDQLMLILYQELEDFIQD